MFNSNLRELTRPGGLHVLRRITCPPTHYAWTSAARSAGEKSKDRIPNFPLVSRIGLNWPGLALLGWVEEQQAPYAQDKHHETAIPHDLTQDRRALTDSAQEPTAAACSLGQQQTGTAEDQFARGEEEERVASRCGRRRGIAVRRNSPADQSQYIHAHQHCKHHMHRFPPRRLLGLLGGWRPRSCSGHLRQDGRDP